jgi:tetratricopeptide (TPR) repeat protein
MSFLFDLLSDNPYLYPLLGLIVLAVVYQKFSHLIKVRVPGGNLSGDDVVGKLLGPRWAEAKQERLVAKYKKGGNFLAAGKILEDLGRFPEAADAYMEGQEFWAAAATNERLGKNEKAAELYLQAGDVKKAAQLLIDAGKPARAALLFQDKGNSLEAARLYGLAGVWDKAAELYSKSGYPLRAAEAFEKLGEPIKAAEAYEKHFMENVSFSTTFSSTAVSTDQKSALLGGRLYEKGGDVKRAFLLYSKGSYWKEAARTALALQDYEKSAELFLRADDPESAASTFDQAGDPVRANNLRGEVALKADQVPEAAAYFVKGHDFLRAAELFEQVGLLAEAAQAYEAGESWASAGSVYIRAGLKDRAAASYEHAGEWETAAKLYEEAGNDGKAIELYSRAGQTYKSGEAAAKAGDREKAISLLQRVGASDENYRPATELLARLFVESRLPALAIERVHKAIGGQPISPANLDLYYWLAVAHEASGNTAEAMDLYKKIQAEDLQFRDVERRVARLATGGMMMTPPLGTAVPPTPPPAVAATPPPPASPVPSPPPVAAVAAAPAQAPAGKGARFAPREEIGSGRLGKVFRAEDTVDGRNVALRILPAGLLQGQGVFAGLVADLKAAAQLSHPNLVKVLGLVELRGDRCLVTELVPGKTFGEALQSGRRMPFPHVHNLGRVLAQTLSFVHGKGLAHGSVKPSNIMVSAGVVKLADLGLGRLAPAESTPENYRAPENVAGPADDLYAMAAVLYHLLTGSHPKQQPQGVGLPLPSKLAPGVPEAMDKLLLRCLHPRPDVRFGSAEEVADELRNMVKIG